MVASNKIRPLSLIKYESSTHNVGPWLLGIDDCHYGKKINQPK